MAVKSYSAGIKEYRETYWMPDYTPSDTDILAVFKITPQAGVPRFMGGLVGYLGYEAVRFFEPT